MAKSIKTRLREIAECEGEIKERQRVYIREQAQAMGVPFVDNGCADCYRDMAVQLWRILCEQENDNGRKYLLRVGIDVIWKGERVNATCNDDELAALLQRGFPRNFFRRIDGEDGLWL